MNIYTGANDVLVPKRKRFEMMIMLCFIYAQTSKEVNIAP